MNPLFWMSRKKDVATAIPVFTVNPVISGICTNGQTLTSTTGTAIALPEGGEITYTRQWQLDGVDITDEVAATYLVDGELGEFVTCDVTATNSLGSATATSNALEIVFDYSTLALPTGQSLARNQTGDNTSYFGSDGLLHWAASDAPRFDHRYTGSAWAFDGLLVEPLRENKQTNYLVGTGWTTTALTIDTEEGTSPDGANNLTLMTETETTVASQHIVYKLATVLVNNYYYAQAVFTAGSKDIIQLSYNSIGFGSTQCANFDLGDGTVSQVLGTDTSAGIEDLSNELYRCWFKAKASANHSSGGVTISMISSSTDARSPSYLGSGGSAYVWGVQQEGVGVTTGPNKTSLIKTTGAAVTRAADELTVPLPSSVTSLTIVHGDDTTTTVAKSALTDAGGGLYKITAVNASLAKYSVKQIRKAA